MLLWNRQSYNLNCLKQIKSVHQDLIDRELLMQLTKFDIERGMALKTDSFFKLKQWLIHSLKAAKLIVRFPSIYFLTFRTQTQFPPGNPFQVEIVNPFNNILYPLLSVHKFSIPNLTSFQFVINIFSVVFWNTKWN